MLFLFFASVSYASLSGLVDAVKRRFSPEIFRKSLEQRLGAAENEYFKFMDLFMESGSAEANFIAWGGSEFSAIPNLPEIARRKRNEVLKKRSRTVQQLLTTWNFHSRLSHASVFDPFQEILKAEALQSDLFVAFIDQPGVTTWHRFVSEMNSVSSVILDAVKELLQIQENAGEIVEKMTIDTLTLSELAARTREILPTVQFALNDVAVAEEALAKSRLNCAVAQAIQVKRNIHENSWTSEFELASFKYVVISQKWAKFIAKADKFAQRMQDKVFESPGVNKKTKSAWLLLQRAFGTQRHFGQMYSSAKFSFPLVFEDVENEVEAKKHVAAARQNLEICKLYMRCKLAVSEDLEKLVKSIH